MPRTVKAKRNQRLVRKVRTGIQAAEDLEILEAGIDRVLSSVQMCMELHDSGWGKSFGISENALSSLNEDAIHLSRRIDAIVAPHIKQAENDPSYRMMLKIVRIGLSQAERNAMLVQRHFPLGVVDNVNDVRAFIDEQRQRYLNYMDAGTDARNSIYDENIGLVHKAADTYANNDDELHDDLLGIATMQFMWCLDHSYDFSQGPLFTTYTMRCMISKCKEHVCHPDMPARIPSGKDSLANSLLSGEVDISALDVSDPDARKEARRVRMALYALGNSVSIDERTGGKPDHPRLRDRLEAGNNEINDSVGVIAVRQVLRQVLDHIGVNAKTLLLLEGRLALENGREPRTLKQIGKDLYDSGLDEQQVSRQCIGQRWNQTRNRLRPILAKVAPELVGGYISDLRA